MDIAKSFSACYQKPFADCSELSASSATTFRRLGTPGEFFHLRRDDDSCRNRELMLMLETRSASEENPSLALRVTIADAILLADRGTTATL
jgi:hypothetical protein